jgi:hypothetical protein
MAEKSKPRERRGRIPQGKASGRKKRTGSHGTGRGMQAGPKSVEEAQKAEEKIPEAKQDYCHVQLQQKPYPEGYDRCEIVAGDLSFAS